MLNHQNFQDIKQVLAVKSTLQEINERVLLKSQKSHEQSPKHTFTLKTLDSLTGQVLPGQSSQSISLDFIPQAETIIRLPHSAGPVAFAAVKRSIKEPDKLEIHPAPPQEIQKLLKNGYQIADQDKAVFDQYKNSLRYRLKLPVFFETAERLIYNIFSGIFLKQKYEYSKDVYMAELILIVVLAIIAVISLWVIATVVS